MNATLAVMGDLLRQALARRWLLALMAAVTLGLVVLSLSLRMDVVDGALAATKLFGSVQATQIQAVDVALRPVFAAVAHILVYGLSAFLVLATADFAPSLLAPGRIEHLLALPVRRWELVLGTYAGVCALAMATALYAAGGLVLVLGVKTGAWTLRPLVAAVFGSLGFAGVYAVMLLAAVLVRSAALSAAAGAGFFVMSTVAGFREALAEALDPGFIRGLFLAMTAFFPRLSRLSSDAAALASHDAFSTTAMAAVMLGFVLFGAGTLALTVWAFERKDF